MDKHHLEDSLLQVQCTLESIRCVANMLADHLSTIPGGPIADSIRMLAEVASGQISEAFQLMKTAPVDSTEVANG